MGAKTEKKDTARIVKEFQIVKLLCAGTKIKDIVDVSKLPYNRILQIKKDAGIKVSVPRGKDKNKMFINTRGKLVYKTKSSIHKIQVTSTSQPSRQ